MKATTSGEINSLIYIISQLFVLLEWLAQVDQGFEKGPVVVENHTEGFDHCFLVSHSSLFHNFRVGSELMKIVRKCSVNGFAEKKNEFNIGIECFNSSWYAFSTHVARCFVKMNKVL